MADDKKITTDTVVAIVACPRYREPDVSAAVRQAFELLGDLSRFVRPGDKVLLKPNLLSARSPDEGVTTHPSVVKAAIEEVKKCGGVPLVGDSPGGLAARNVFEKVASKSGIKQICQESGARLVNLGEEIVEFDNPEGKLFKRFNLSDVFVQSDVVINLPKLKTHSFMTLTAAVKNLFGCIPGLQKAEFHLKVPDRDDFADMLVDLYLAIKPQLNLIDGIVTMEGPGPSAGELRSLGLILAGNDALALDLIAAQILGFTLSEVPTHRAALKRSLFEEDLRHIEVKGLSVAEVKVRHFKKPEGAIQDRVPSFLTRKAKNLVTPKPVVDQAACSGCRECAEACPIKVIEFENGRPEFDYDTCIRCYCCQELCPRSAIKLKTNWLGRLFSKH